MVLNRTKKRVPKGFLKNDYLGDKSSKRMISKLMSTPTTIVQPDGTVALIFEEQKFREKHALLKRKIKEIEETNVEYAVKISKAKRAIQRLKVEKRILFEKIEASNLLQTQGQKFKTADEIDASSEVSDTEDKTATDTGKKKKKPRDPNAPKRPANAFIMFCHMEREQLKAARQEIPNDLSKILSARWKEMPPEQKKVYFDKYEKEMARYAAEMAEYSSNPQKETSAQQATSEADMDDDDVE